MGRVKRLGFVGAAAPSRGRGPVSVVVKEGTGAGARHGLASPRRWSVGDALPAYVAGITACQNARGCAPEGLTMSALPTVCEVCQATARTRYSQRCRLTPQATDPQLQCVLSSVRGPRAPREVLPAKYGPSPCGQNLQMLEEGSKSWQLNLSPTLRDVGSAHASRQHRRRCATRCSSVPPSTTSGSAASIHCVSTRLPSSLNNARASCAGLSVLWAP